MNVLVTGANGYLGRHLTSFLRKQRHNVWAGTRSQVKAMSTEQGVWVGEDCHGVAEFLEDNAIDAVVHMGADAAIASKDKSQLVRNVSYTQNLLRACNGQKFIFASTVMMYDDCDDCPLIEPVDEYSLSKRLCEELVWYYYGKGRISSTNCMRLCGVLGPGLKKGIVHKILTSGSEVTLYGESPGSELGFLDIDDFLSLVPKVLDSKEIKWPFFDVVPIDTISLKEICQVYGKTIKWVYGEKNRRVKGEKYWAESNFRWTPDYTTRQAIRRYYYSLKSEGVIT